ncbi:flocculation protein FLO11 [Denticeps clupeoides]|uniref:Uncharacterized protein n=1 Tax=Denticeps clupeoides TaxID=299321 RepID=A0AAY4E3P3_9TELE|nr:flocculation protein FLO11-like [Denticeps clupeoides]XP_028830355.1 flocculation protein FLO11-like [Denticeps clupeoides]
MWRIQGATGDMVSKEPNSLPTAHSHSNGNPEKTPATMTVRSVLLNRNSPDIESRLKRRRNRTQQVRFKDLEDGEDPKDKLDSGSPHPTRTPTPTSSWKDGIGNGPSLVGAVRGDMEGTIGAVTAFLKRAPPHPLTPGPTRRSWASPRPCSLTLPFPRQPCMSTAIQTSPSLQKPPNLSASRSQSLIDSVKASQDTEEDDLLIVTKPCCEPNKPSQEDKCSTLSHALVHQPPGLCTRDDLSTCDLSEIPFSCPTAASKACSGRPRGRRRGLSRAVSDPGKPESPTVSPSKALTSGDGLTQNVTPSSSPLQNVSPCCSSSHTAPLAHSSASSTKHRSCALDLAGISSTTASLSQTSHSTNMPSHVSIPQIPSQLNTDSCSCLGGESSYATPVQTTSSEAVCNNMKQSLPSCKTTKLPGPSCKSPTQSVKTCKIPVQTPSKSTVIGPAVTQAVPPSATCTQNVATFKTPTQPLPSSKTLTQTVQSSKDLKQMVSSKMIPFSKSPAETVPSSKICTQSAPSSNSFPQTVSSCKTATLPVPTCKSPVQTLPICKTITQTMTPCSAPIQTIASTQSMLCSKIPAQSMVFFTPSAPTVASCNTYENIAPLCPAASQTAPFSKASIQTLPPCIPETSMASPCPPDVQAVLSCANQVKIVAAGSALNQILPGSVSGTKLTPSCVTPQKTLPPYIDPPQSIPVCSSPHNMIPHCPIPAQTMSPSTVSRQTGNLATPPVGLSCVYPMPPYVSPPRAIPSPPQAPYSTQDRILPPPPPPPPPYTPRKEGISTSGQARQPPLPKAESEEGEKEKKVGNGPLTSDVGASGLHCSGTSGVVVPCLPPKNNAQATIKAAALGAQRAIFGSQTKACTPQHCARTSSSQRSQQQSHPPTTGPSAGQADTLKQVQELLGGLMSGAKCKLDLARAKEKLLGPNGPLYDIGSLQSQLHSLEGVLETSQNTIKVLLDVIQDLEKKEAERDGRHSYRTGQDIENCGTCRDCACIIYSVEHDFRQQEGQVTRAWRVPEPQEAEQSSPQTVLPPRSLDSPQSVKKSRKKCFWFL